MGQTGALTFAEIAPEVFVLRHPVLDVNATLVVGGEVGAVVDTLSTEAQAIELLAAIRAVTAAPLIIVNTHHHFDHCYGNGVLAAASMGCAIWAHEAAAATLREHGPRLQRAWYEEFLPTKPDLAEELAAVDVVPPNRTVHTESTIDIGGRLLELRHLGRGHTEGDLVEQGAPPSFGDSYPLDWPETVTALLHLVSPSTAVIPGHGSVVDLDFVRAQHDELTELAWLIREGDADGATPAAVAAKAPFGHGAALTAIKRGYAELSGRI